MTKLLQYLPDQQHAFWLWSCAGAVLVALASHFSNFPFIPVSWQHYIELAAFVYSVVSAKISQNGK